MRTAVAIALMLFGACAAQAHSYRIGNLEIVHPAIMVPEANSDCTCAHVTITNHGSEPEYFLGADVQSPARRGFFMSRTTGMVSALPPPWR